VLCKKLENIFRILKTEQKSEKNGKMDTQEQKNIDVTNTPVVVDKVSIPRPDLDFLASAVGDGAHSIEPPLHRRGLDVQRYFMESLPIRFVLA
jgi:hypothetical protein